MKLSRKYYCIVEPYVQLLKEHNTELIRYERGAIFSIDERFMRYLSKATGLKSNKARHIKKRFKLVFKRLLEDYIDESR